MYYTSVESSPCRSGIRCFQSGGMCLLMLGAKFWRKERMVAPRQPLKGTAAMTSSLGRRAYGPCTNWNLA